MRYPLADGAPFVLHGGDKLSDLIFTGRAYEPLETGFCRRFLRAGDVAFDIGANIGYFTALFSRCVGPTGRVIALEPGQHTWRLLSQTIAGLALENVSALPVALWHRSQILAFHASCSGDDAQQSVARRDKHERDMALVPVPALSFADLAASDWFTAMAAPALVKIDVEGAEPQVMQGMQDFLEGTASPPAMLVECNAEALRAMGNDPAELLRTLARHHELYATPLCWPPWHAAAASFTPCDPVAASAATAELNLLAVPRSGPLRDRALQAMAAP